MMEKRRREPIMVEVPQSLQNNPWQSMRAMAKDLGLSEGTVHTVVKEDLGCKSYTRPKRHLISSGAKSRHLERANKLVNKLEHNNTRVNILSSDLLARIVHPSITVSGTTMTAFCARRGPPTWQS